MLKIDLAKVLDLEKFLSVFPDTTNKAASYAMNDVLAGQGLARYKKAVAAEVPFPGGYVDDKIEFGQRATPSRLVASVVARQRPTSLARFATSGSVGAKGGVTIRTKTGAKYMKSAFMVRLNAGSGITDDGFNLGLAIRLKEGLTLNKKDTSRMVHLEANVVLLYGPSVDQILRNEVSESTTPEVVDAIAVEFFRQIERMS